MSTALVNNLRDKIEQHNLSVAGLEKEAGLKINSVRNILHGKSKNPGAETIKAIAKTLNCTVDELLDSPEEFLAKNQILSIKEESRSQSRNVAQENLIITHFPLFQECFQSVLNIFVNEGNPVYSQDILFLTCEVYQYSLNHNEEHLDKNFLQWLYERNYK